MESHRDPLIRHEDVRPRAVIIAYKGRYFREKDAFCCITIGLKQRRGKRPPNVQSVSIRGVRYPRHNSCRDARTQMQMKETKQHPLQEPLQEAQPPGLVTTKAQSLTVKNLPQPQSRSFFCKMGVERAAYACDLPSIRIERILLIRLV